MNLSTLIRNERKNANLTLDNLQDLTEISKTTLSQYENNSLPSAENLIKIFNAINNTESSLTEWIKIWTSEQINKIENKAIKTEWQSAVDLLGSTSTSISTHQKEKILNNFPNAFLPLTIILGDRRQIEEPKNLADIFLESLSVIDVMNLLDAFNYHFKDGDIEIISDKFFAIMDEKDLQVKFGKRNIMIIGSPLVNFAARKINSYCFFRFSDKHNMRDFENVLSSARILKDVRMLKDFWDFTQKKDNNENFELIHMKEKNILPNNIENDLINELKDLAKATTERFREPSSRIKNQVLASYKREGIIDIIENRVADFCRKDNDFGLVSLGANPFSESYEYSTIYVAGLHGPGTTTGLKLLSSPSIFKEHPLGGVFEVLLNPEKPYYERVRDSIVDWKTGKYDNKKIKQIIKELINNAPKYSNLNNNPQDWIECNKYISNSKKSDNQI